MNIACMISCFRIFLTFVTIWALYISRFDIALMSFVCACVSDVLDGFVARILNQQTTFGQILDPVADKIYAMAVLIALICIEQHSRLQYILLFLLIKELILLSVGAWLWFVHHRFIQPSKFSRLASFFEFGLMFSLLLGYAACMSYGLVFIFSVFSVVCSIVLFILYGRLLFGCKK